MTVSMMIQFEGKQLTLPINPSKLLIERSATNENIEIIGIGNATRKGNPSLTKVSISSFFPAANSYFYTGVTPQSCVNFINNIWKADNKNNNVAKIVTLGLPVNLNMFFVIESFTPEMRAGEEDDIYYTLNIKEYIPYGVKTVTVQQSGLAASRASAAAKAAAAAANNQSGGRQTYTVVKGDCLWNITKACCGNGARWQELYNLNKSVIGNNPNLIYPGQVLVLPDGWTTPANVTKLTNVNASSSTSRATTSATTSSTAASTPAASSSASTTTSSSSSVPALKDIVSPNKKLTPAQQLELEQLQRELKYKNLGLHT